MDEPGKPHVKCNNPDREKNILHGIKKKVELIDRVEWWFPGARR